MQLFISSLHNLTLWTQKIAVQRHNEECGPFTVKRAAARIRIRVRCGEVVVQLLVPNSTDFCMKPGKQLGLLRAAVAVVVVSCWSLSPSHVPKRT